MMLSRRYGTGGVVLSSVFGMAGIICIGGDCM